MLEWEGQRDGALWLSGDTVYFAGVAEIGERFEVGTAILNLGGVRFPLTGPARYTMNAAEAIGLPGSSSSSTLVPLHYEGWKHFRQGRAELERPSRRRVSRSGCAGSSRRRPVSVEV